MTLSNPFGAISMPFKRTWTNEDLDYLIWAYKNDIPHVEQMKILKRSPQSISDMARRLGLTDAERRVRIRANLGQVKITEDVLRLIEEYVIDWGYSSKKISQVLKAEHGINLVPSGIREAIHNRASAECKRYYSRFWGVSLRKKKSRSKKHGSHPTASPGPSSD